MKKLASNIICGFPGVGKSRLTETLHQYTDLKVFDSDSSTFPKDSFPANYIDHIKTVTEKYPDAIVLVSSHETVRNALIGEGIPFMLVYPEESCKQEYMRRYQDRGSPKVFLNLLDNQFQHWVAECDYLQHPLVTKVRLTSDQYLSNIINNERGC